MVATAAEKAPVTPASDGFQEQIYYFDPARPPVIEVSQWKPEGWELCWVKYDSDGDWALDAAMHFWKEPKDLSEAEKNARRKRWERLRAIQKDGVLFIPFDETRKNLLRLYPQAALYPALGADKKFRFSGDGYLRLLQAPSPSSPKNFDLRYSAAYRGLLERLSTLKLSEPPAVPDSK